MKQHLSDLLLKALKAAEPDFEPDPRLWGKIKLERARDRAHGDFASNAALILAKPLGTRPADLARRLTACLEPDESVSRVEIAGPGFINFFVNPHYLTEKLAAMSADPRLGVRPAERPLTVVVDYSSPNVAKEMAVHHIRSTVIGDAVVRALEFLGHRVVRANHIGDWGTQFGMLIAYLESLSGEAATDLALEDFEDFYRRAKQRYDGDEAFALKSRSYVVKLQGGDPRCRSLWQRLVDLTMTQNQKLYDRLDVTLSMKDIMGESLYNPMLEGIVADLTERGIAVEDHGAVVVYLPQYKNQEGGPLGTIIRKSDGGYLYTTTDIACVKYRVERLHADRILYFTDSRQQQHLEITWEICRRAGYAPPGVSIEHCPFGMMLGRDGRPFKTRSGGTVKLRELLDEAEARVEALLNARGSALSGETRREVTHNIAVGAVKYADLSKNRTTDYIFDWDQMLSFEGNTAPYLQYAYSRVRAVFRKAELSPGRILLTCEAEEELARRLLAFGETVGAVALKSMPNLLCTYLYELSNLFMRFYESCPVLRAPEETQRSRLALCGLTGRVLRQGLDLLGIKVMEQM